MANRFIDGDATYGPLSAANLNSLDRGGNVYRASGGGLFFDVSACRFCRHDPWAVVEYAGATNQAVGASTTTYVYISTTGTLTTNTTGFPATAHIPLATIVTDGSGITSITDKRFMAFLP